ncbi:hypothetical protein N7510_003782 [Penicillium lagena]|uniref:uncharacterized protein n=1 Tax=Penicillium lagena TaxID=94218 RepID=UPI0025402C8F|nr:uncharacterized protein N7510_003782 [Penicillium lagena]KAJ5619798.1 hypothetical protein N7510_003782 [Penicillium lagena]
MTVSDEQKDKSTRRLFGILRSNRFTITKVDTSPTESAASESPASGSKLLFLFRLRDSFTSTKTSSTEPGSPTTPQSTNEVSGPSSNDTEGDSSTDASPAQTQSLASSSSPSVEPDAINPVPGSSPAAGYTAGKEAFQPHGRSEVQQDTTTDDDKCIILSESPNTTRSKLDRISQKISSSINRPTVIRRGHLRNRPSVLVLDFAAPSNLSKQGDAANDISNPSTTPSSNGSPLSGQSTPPTSGEPSPSPERSKPFSEQVPRPTDWGYLSSRDLGVKSAPAAIMPPSTSPSVWTVEAASAAKIFFEVHFDSLLANVNARSQRQQELEDHIYLSQLTLEDQIVAKHNWVMQENEHLRRCRALKSTLCCPQSTDAVSKAGYEAIKVLGKGSFGVVRLVREKDSPKTPSEDGELLRTNDNSANMRSRHMDLLRPALDGSRRSRRRYMTGERKGVYAMKIIRKSEMIRNCQEGHIRAERDFMVTSAKSRWIVPLIASFQDANNLYLVMDFMVGGDFLGLLIRHDILNEDCTRWYVAEMILCIEEAHKLGWIHRDIKPDNFLISPSGHLKISDFGLAFNGHWSHDQVYYAVQRYSLLDKLGIRIEGDDEDQEESANAKETSLSSIDKPGLKTGRELTAGLPGLQDIKDKRRLAKSMVGTSQYMAPEVIRGEVYDGRCDWWSVGIILYECLYGFTPFACESRRDTKIKILASSKPCFMYLFLTCIFKHHVRTLHFPRERSHERLVSQEAIDVICQILQEREFRLCSRRYHANDFLDSRAIPMHYVYSTDPRHRSNKRSYVYPNDAGPIKTHSFFRGIPWEEIHRLRPPMVPKVRNWEDTRYFDDWKSLVGGLDDPSDTSTAKAAANPAIPVSQEPSSATTSLEAQASEEEAVEEDTAEQQQPAVRKMKDDEKKQKEKKRARDVMLRDKEIGKIVLEMRKKSAFLGYTYRRPRAPAVAVSMERGRQPLDRGQFADLYAL